MMSSSNTINNNDTSHQQLKERTNNNNDNNDYHVNEHDNNNNIDTMYDDDRSLLSADEDNNQSVTSTSSSKLMTLMNEAFDLDAEIVFPIRRRADRNRNNLNNSNNDLDSVVTHVTIKSMTLEAIHETASFVMAHWKILLFGQFISLAMATGGAAQATMNFECQVSAPLFTSGVFFTLLSLYLIPVYARGMALKRGRLTETTTTKTSIKTTAIGQGDAFIWFLRIFPIKTQPWRYLVIAFLDVQACYCTILAFKYTPMTSVTLFASLAVPSAMVLSKLFLGRSFGVVHFLGVSMCMIGVVYNVLADYHVDEMLDGNTTNTTTADQDEYPNRLFGDFLAIMGGIIYGIVDVVAEGVLKADKGDTTEFLGMLGFFASIISMTQGWLTERNDIIELYTGGSCSGYGTAALVLLYVLASSLEFIGIAHFLSKSEATLLNLSCLTDPALWSVLFTIFAQNVTPPPLFWAALVFVVGGLIVYELAPSPIAATEITISSLLKDDFDHDNQSETHISYTPEMQMV